RTRATGSSTPISRSAARATWAIHPAPRITALPGRSTPASRSASAIAPTSVLSANQRPSRRSSVFAAPTAAASGDTSSAASSASPRALGHGRPAPPPRGGGGGGVPRVLAPSPRRIPPVGQLERVIGGQVQQGEYRVTDRRAEDRGTWHQAASDPACPPRAGTGG